MSSFYVGQRVICVDDTETACVSKGSVYTVIGVWEIYLELDHHDNGTKGGMHASRFRPVDPLDREVQRIERRGRVEIEISEPVLN